MISVIIAGGSGTRLWPLSTPDYPKHLLKINGQNKSLLQNTYERVKEISSTVYVITDKSHAHHIKDQLPDLPDDNFIMEPARRGTANCIVAGLVVISQQTANHDEPIAFLPADHYIRDVKGFAYTFARAETVSQKEGRIVLIGVEPNYAATGFGYIQKGEKYEKSLVFNVHSFKEKPDFKTAQKYLKSGNYVWNSGSFVGSVNTFLEKIKNYAPDLFENYQKLTAAKNQDDYLKTYLTFESDSIDYALIERVKDLLVIPAAFDWMDLGSFPDLHKAVDIDEQGNHYHGEQIEVENVTNSFIQNYEDRPLAVIGLDGVVVVNSPNGILVARKDLAQKVGDVSKRFHKEKK